MLFGVLADSNNIKTELNMTYIKEDDSKKII